MHEAVRAFSIAAGLLALSGPATGQQFHGDKRYGEYYEEEKKWAELDAALPAFPKPQYLIEFDAGAATGNRHYVDGSTLSVGEDRVVRYVVVVKTGGGATNISYEGIRCDTRMRKLYAFGHTGEVWSKSRQPEWQPIRPGSYHAVLTKEYFCPMSAAILKAEEGVDALKRGAHPEAK